jgi:hypothetical protein
MLIELTKEQKNELLDSVQPELLSRIQRIASDTYQKEIERVINSWFLKLDDNVGDSLVFRDCLNKAVKSLYHDEIKKQIEAEQHRILNALEQSIKTIVMEVLNDKNKTPEHHIKNAMTSVVESIIREQYTYTED